MTLLILGNAMVDSTFDVAHLPRPGETLLAARKRHAVGGKGLNQAVAAHRAGAEVRFVAAVGADPGGELIRRQVAAEGLPADGLVAVAAETDESVIFVAAANGENVIVSTSAAASALPPARVEAELDRLRAGDRLLLQGNLTREVTELALRRGRSRGARILLNPAPIGFDYAGLLALANIVVLNEVEADRLGTGQAPVTVVTHGARGLEVLGRAGDFAVPAPEVAVVDTTGAGDVVCGVLAAGLELGLPLPAALRWAVAAAAIKVTRVGAFTGIPDAAELAALRP